jgi:hypothetical protein
MKEQTLQNNTRPLWLRITSAIFLFLIIGAGYFTWWAFWTGMSHWADTVPNQNTADQFYLAYVYGPMLFVFLLVPAVITVMNIRWLWKGFYWLLSLILAFIGWVVWFIVIEATSK